MTEVGRQRKIEVCERRGGCEREGRYFECVVWCVWEVVRFWRLDWFSSGADVQGAGSGSEVEQVEVSVQGRGGEVQPDAGTGVRCNGSWKARESRVRGREGEEEWEKKGKSRRGFSQSQSFVWQEQQHRAVSRQWHQWRKSSWSKSRSRSNINDNLSQSIKPSRNASVSAQTPTASRTDGKNLTYDWEGDAGGGLLSLPFPLKPQYFLLFLGVLSRLVLPGRQSVSQSGVVGCAFASAPACTCTCTCSVAPKRVISSGRSNG